MVGPYRIRPATRADLAAVAAIERAVFADPWPAASFRRHLDDPFLVAARPQTGVTGYVVTRVTVPEAEILNVAVVPEHRAQGIGGALIRAALDALRQRGAGRVYLEVRVSNTAARRLYERCGFRVVGRRPRLYRNPPEDALLLARDIGSA